MDVKQQVTHSLTNSANNTGGTGVLSLLARRRVICPSIMDRSYLPLGQGHELPAPLAWTGVTCPSCMERSYLPFSMDRSYLPYCMEMSYLPLLHGRSYLPFLHGQVLSPSILA